jgi:hypothetical protein
MRSSPLRTAAVILLLLMTVTIRWWQVDKAAVPSSIMQTKGSESGMQSTPSSTAEEEGSPSVRGKRPDLPKSGLGAGLPEIQGEEIASAAVHTRIPAGHSLVTGGYQMGDGHHEFVVLTPKWLETPSGKKQIQLESRILNVNEEALLSTGLNSLVTGEQKTIQNADVWTPEDVTRTLTDAKGLNLLSSPSIVVNPGGSAQVQIGNTQTSFTLDLVASEAPDGGFELKSEIKRVE